MRIHSGISAKLHHSSTVFMTKLVLMFGKRFVYYAILSIILLRNLGGFFSFQVKLVTRLSIDYRSYLQGHGRAKIR